MQVAEYTDSLPLEAQTTAVRRVQLFCRLAVLVLAACQLWTGRYVIDTDGTGYIDVARAYLHRDWLHALSPYWSPLYIWELTVTLGLVRPSIHWELPLVHAVSFVNFALAFAAWEWLIAEWEKWQGPPSSPLLTYITGYCVVLWAGVRLTSLWWFNTPDILVMALLIAVTALLVRIRSGRAGRTEFALFGLALGAGFLAKSAFLVIIPVFFAVLVFLCPSRRRPETGRRVSIAAAATAALIVPFVAAISIAHGRFTAGDSGRLNYSWEVSGFSVEGYKENAYWPGEVKHPIRVLEDRPRVLSLDQDAFGTYPIHADVSWWSEGYPLRFDKDRQMMILWSDIMFSVYAFRCPALLLFLLGLVFAGRRTIKNFGQAWFVWAPGLLFAATYCPVYSDYRYLAGSYAVMGFGLIAGVWRVPLPRRVATISTWIIPVLTGAVLMGGTFRQMPPQLIRDIAGKRTPWSYYSVQVAETMYANGLRPGDRVAYIGFDSAAAHVGLEQATIVAMVPQRATHDDRIRGRPYAISFPQPDEFWRSSAEQKQKVFAAFRSVGAKWVFADTVPKWADIEGWQVAGPSHEMRSKDRPFTYFRKLF